MRLVVSFLMNEGKLDLENICDRSDILSDWWFAVK
jgi:hypothetical protein